MPGEGKAENDVNQALNDSAFVSKNEISWLKI